MRSNNMYELEKKALHLPEKVDVRLNNITTEEISANKYKNEITQIRMMYNNLYSGQALKLINLRPAYTESGDVMAITTNLARPFDFHKENKFEIQRLMLTGKMLGYTVAPYVKVKEFSKLADKSNFMKQIIAMEITDLNDVQVAESFREYMKSYYDINTILIWGCNYDGF